MSPVLSLRLVVQRAAAALMLGLATSAPALPQVKNPDTYTYATITDADSLDPAWSYDTASHFIALNIYEPLFDYEGTSTERLEPRIATQVPSRANGLLSKDGKTYRIPIRKGVRFHDGTPMTPEDVRYSILRFLLQDRDAGPSSLLLQPLVGYPATRDEKGKLNPNAYKDAARAVQVEGDRVVLRLPKPYAPLLTILAQWAPVLSKQWAAKNGDWDGSEATWAKYNNPAKQNAPFFEKANGTGPFMLERWERRTKELILARNENYWRKPAKLKRVIIKTVTEMGTRKLMLQAGDVDNVYCLSPEYNQFQNLPGIEVIDDLPTIEMNPVAYFTFKINPVANPYIGSGKLDGNGVPPDFFSDLDVRKGFSYAFDYQGFIRDVFRGKGTQATGCIPKTLPGHNPKQRVYSLDLEKSRAHFQKAWGGKVWENGFEFSFLYNSGNTIRENLCQILKRNIEGLNPKFRINVRPVEWPTFLDGYKASKLPVFIIGWKADFPDPHNFAFPLMHSQGSYPFAQRYKNPQADRWVEQALDETNPEKRKKIYQRLQELEFEDVPHLLFIDQALYRVQRTWVKGWINNPVFPDAPWGAYFYPMYKEAPKP
ncbi:MAG: ABC transporter substrate-binding protein [Elusimicrobia bacterium]|nr:ABC transporter substrate-binding protein [Elusimicrobiota bacterium]